MSNKFKNADIKNHTYYFFDYIINVKDFDPNKVKIDKKSQKNILHYSKYFLHWIGDDQRFEILKT